MSSNGRPISKETLFIAARPTATIKELQEAAAVEGMELTPKVINQTRYRLQNGLCKNPSIKALLPKKEERHRRSGSSKKPTKPGTSETPAERSHRVSQAATNGVSNHDYSEEQAPWDPTNYDLFRVPVVHAASGKEAPVRPVLPDPSQKLLQLRKLVLELGLDAVQHAIRDYVWARDNPR